MLRRIGAVVAGLAIAFVIVAIAEALTHRMYPPAAGTNMEDMAQVKTYVGSLPLTALVLVLLGWTIGTLLGAAVATRIARTNAAGYAVGAVLLAAGIMNAVTIPQPMWFSIASFAVFVFMTAAGVALARPRMSAVAVQALLSYR